MVYSLFYLGVFATSHSYFLGKLVRIGRNDLCVVFLYVLAKCLAIINNGFILYDICILVFVMLEYVYGLYENSYQTKPTCNTPFIVSGLAEPA